jgi:hypothetical protein
MDRETRGVPIGVHTPVATILVDFPGLSQPLCCAPGGVRAYIG